MTSPMFLVVEGEIVPYVRMTRAGKYVDPRAQRYLASKEAISLQVQAVMSRKGYSPVPQGAPFRAVMRFSRYKLYTCDLDNLVKAVLDAMNGIAYPDDRWCVSLNVDKGRGPRGRDTTFIEIEEVLP